ncbi:MAG: putative exodeoxyribonuclease 8 [Prokaryotic dsDNA virus sp.]|nr:MAG: putative exodeoxyribonuclease 8 [Prokaryotic dsDNA virus sp.]|tara:strand:+ start:1627 stop:2385 length:759 start_codon:yes stop_codon:yes gene_type:complete
MELEEVNKLSKNLIDKLRSDKNYYGKFGKKFLSNSDISTLLNNPRMFKKYTKPSTEMLKGSYFHTAMLEPEKLDDFIICSSSSRTAKIYKDILAETGEDIVLLAKEVEELNQMTSELKSNVILSEIIYEQGNIFEEPAVGKIGGQLWKGKADIVRSDLVVDLKTTSRIDDFHRSARKYNYDSQAWIYEQLFERPVVFIAIEKGSCRMGMYDCSEQFLDSGREKVMRALEVYNTFFGESPTEDIDQFFINKTL